MKIKLEITEGQAQVIRDACELFSRLHMGQLGELRELNWPGMIKRDVRETEHLCKLLKMHLFPELGPNAYHGINSPEIPDRARVAYDIHQVIRRHLAGPRPEGSFPYVIYDDPMRTSENEPLAVIVPDAMAVECCRSGREIMGHFKARKIWLRRRW